jgi:hypothetical protein
MKVGRLVSASYGVRAYKSNEKVDGPLYLIFSDKLRDKKKAPTGWLRLTKITCVKYSGLYATETTKALLRLLHPGKLVLG